MVAPKLVLPRRNQLPERLREKVEHLLGSAFGQKIFDVCLCERREANLDAFVREDFDFGLVAVALFVEAPVVFDGAQRVVLAVRVNDEDGGAVVGHHQLFDEHARRVRLARARGGEYGEVR